MSLFNEQFFESLFSQTFQPNLSIPPVQVQCDGTLIGGRLQPPVRSPQQTTDDRAAVYGQPVFQSPQTNLSGLIMEAETSLPSLPPVVNEPNIGVPESDSQSILLNESRPSIAIRDAVKDLRGIYRHLKTLTEVITATMSWIDNDIAGNIRRPASLLHTELQRLENLVIEARTKLGNKLYGCDTSETTIDVDSVS